MQYLNKISRVGGGWVYSYVTSRGVIQLIVPLAAEIVFDFGDYYGDDTDRLFDSMDVLDHYHNQFDVSFGDA